MTHCFRLVLLLNLAAGGAHANFIISNFSLTDTSISFDISGTLPVVPPDRQPYGMVLQSPSHPATFTTVDITHADTVNSTRSHGSVFADDSGFSNPDYFYIDYGEDDLVPGALFTDSFSAIWSTPVFNPSTEVIEFRWGWEEPNIGGDILLATVNTTIPEPSSALFFLVGALLLRGFAKQRPGPNPRGSGPGAC